MRIKLENIGMLKGADVKIDGLTVIAGENDTGKSTIGKMLFMMLSNLVHHSSAYKNDSMEKRYYPDIEDVFGNGSLLKEGYFARFEGSGAIEIKATKKGLHSKPFVYNPDSPVKIPFFIDTPDVLNKAKYIKNTNLLMTQNKLKFFLPVYVTDLILRLSQDISKTDKESFFKTIKDVISGEVFYDSQKDDFYFKKDGLEYPVNMHSTANGIKMFGFLQILIANGSLSKDSVLILDEPEVNLHPKWQLKYAEILIELIKSGVYVIVNSHSPYMIEALKVYSDKSNIQEKTNFYLAEKNEDGITASIKDSTDDLEPIFAKLAEPFDKIETIKIEDFKW
ncbi:MAG: AAA family ATPase [Campylobacterales bacterium]